MHSGSADAYLRIHGEMTVVYVGAMSERLEENETRFLIQSLSSASTGTRDTRSWTLSRPFLALAT